MRVVLPAPDGAERMKSSPRMEIEVPGPDGQRPTVGGYHTGQCAAVSSPHLRRACNRAGTFRGTDSREVAYERSLDVAERIDGSHGAIEAIVCEVLGEELPHPVDLGVGPEVGVEPR